MRLKDFVKALPFLFLAAWIGCTKTPPPLNTASQAQVKFTKICQDEFQLTVLTNLIGNTLWIYVPFEKPIYDIARDETNEKQKEKISQAPPKRSSLLYIDGKTEDKSFHFEYDITPATKAAKPPGYSVVYTEDFAKTQNNILTALTRSFFELKEDVKPPDFIVLVICDIKKGLEVKNTFNMEDLRQYTLGFLPQEEYLQRYLQDASGNKSFIGDTDGGYLDFKAVEWPDFLLKQIVNRVQFKYQSSDFPPGEDAESEILRIVQQVFKIYKFTDYRSVKLSDLLNKKEYSFDPAQLKTFGQ